MAAAGGDSAAAVAALAFPKKHLFGQLSYTAVKARQQGLGGWLNAALEITEGADARLAAFLRRPPKTVEVTAVWPADGPLGINFAPDLSVLATSPATQRSHPHVVPGLSLLRVQGTPVAGLDYAASIGLVKGANRPLELVFAQEEEGEEEEEGDGAEGARCPVQRVEVTDSDLGTDDAGKEYVLFCVVCFGSEGELWRVSKRFSEFSELRDALSRSDAGSGSPTRGGIGLLGGQRAQAEPVLAVFVCAHRTIVRAEIALDSAQTGTLEVGEEFEVVERRQLEDGALRVRGADGWCTAVNADGVAILEEQQLPMVARIRITDTESHRDKNRVGEYTSYVIECVGEGEPWRIVKRFSDFSRLREQLEERGVGPLAREGFPAKVLFGGRDESVVVYRKLALESVCPTSRPTPSRLPNHLGKMSAQGFLRVPAVVEQAARRGPWRPGAETVPAIGRQLAHPTARGSRGSAGGQPHRQPHRGVGALPRAVLLRRWWRGARAVRLLRTSGAEGLLRPGSGGGRVDLFEPSAAELQRGGRLAHRGCE